MFATLGPHLSVFSVTAQPSPKCQVGVDGLVMADDPQGIVRLDEDCFTDDGEGAINQSVRRRRIKEAWLTTTWADRSFFGPG